ncbi:unnamed protein product [Adineta ricciae]|uniref:Uncharacterized protein n=1 Tax=Adineta ricciae TaxID=249248 RepID=A0A815NUF9_ADIRI|nr:unnamed protein product [Adineta ricciae]
MFFLLLFLCNIHLVIALSSLEDLAVTKHFQIGCLTLKSNKQFIATNLQENHLLPYQTYSSSNMSVGLCFRLCRRWLILLDKQNTTCICLYTLNKLYELNEHLGEYSSDHNCPETSVQIYSITKDSTSLPLLTSSVSDDWSFDGCYELENIQYVRMTIPLTNSDFPTALDRCRKHCWMLHGANYYAYFLSRKKSCYCLPIEFPPPIKTAAIRKPLTHCSFLPSICQGFGNSCRQYYSQTNVDTLVKIDVHHYCSSIEPDAFVFDRIFYRCLKLVTLRRLISISTINYDQKCSPITIKTREQWNYLIHSSWVTNTNLFIQIDRNSTYLYRDLFKSNSLVSSSNLLCVVIKRTDSNAVLGELIQCLLARPPGSVLCAQKPYPSAIPHDEEFQNTNVGPEISTNETLTCPPEFVLFNRMCYYADPSLTYGIQAGEQICASQHSNSTLVTFNSHEWANINVSRFLGRAFNDILLEFFYYILEKKLPMGTELTANRNQQIRLLLGDKISPEKCLLRYFTRSIGGFSLMDSCTNGGYPICQTQPMRMKVSSTTLIPTTITPINTSSIEQMTTQIIPINSTTSSLILTNDINNVSSCDNCTANLIRNDEDPVDNQTKIYPESDMNSTKAILQPISTLRAHVKYRSLVLILTGPVLGLLILILGVALLIWRVRQNAESYSIRNSFLAYQRTKRSSTTATVSDVPTTPVIVGNRIKPKRRSAGESGSSLLSHHFSPDDDTIELYATTKTPLIDSIPEEPCSTNMSLTGKKPRDPSHLPTLSYEIKLNLPVSVDSKPQEISFLDLIANDTKFKNDKESLELVLSSYVKACGKQSVKEILAECDTTVDENASLSDIIHALMDYNDQQNANLGVGYNDPEDDDSFIDDSTAAQDIIPRNMTNERDGFYVNEKHQPINARYLSDPSESESEEEEDDDSDDDDDDDDESNESERDEKQTKKTTDREDDGNEKAAKKSKTVDDIATKPSTVKRKRSISEVTAPNLPVNLDDKTKSHKPVEESVKKIQKLTETTPVQSTSDAIPYVLPNEMESDIKPCIDKLVKLIVSESTMNNKPKKIERLFHPTICRELLDLVKKLHRHTNAHRQLAFDILSLKTGICAQILVTRARSILLNDYEPSAPSSSLSEMKNKLKAEINRSLEIHIQAHNQAVKEWQQKMAENPSKDKNRGPRKNFRLYKTINELIIRCLDRKLESMTVLDLESLELFLHDQIVPLWEKSGWMTAKKITSEVIRLEYRPLKDPNPPSVPSLPVHRTTPISPTAERVKKDSTAIPLLPAPPLPGKVSNTHVSPTKPVQQQTAIKTNENKSSNHVSSNSNPLKAVELATRVSTNVVKQHTSRPSPTGSASSHSSEQSSHKSSKTDLNRSLVKPSVASQPETATKRNSTPNLPSVLDLTMDILSQFKKPSDELLLAPHKAHSPSLSNKDPSSSSYRSSSSSSSSSHSKQQQQQFATKLPSEKSSASSFLKDALMTSASAPSPKMSSSPLTVDNMLSKSHHSPKSTSSTSTSASKLSATAQSPTPNPHRSSGSHKSSSSRPSVDFSSHKNEQQIQQQKTSSSSNRSQANIGSSATPKSSSVSPASRRSTSTFTGTHESQSNRSHTSSMTIPSSLSQSLQWDPATLQLAAAALSNPQLLSSTMFDPTLFNSMFGTVPNIVSSNQSSSSRQQQSNNNNRRS